MYYINTSENVSESDLEMYCDECKNDEIRETTSGFVCADCGIVLEHPKMEYHSPYEENKVQYAPLGTTQIGLRYERRSHTNPRKLSLLQKLQNRKKYEEVMDIAAKKTISTISSHLELPGKLYQLYFMKYKEIRENLTKGTKFRSPEKLVPVVIYYCTKYRNIFIDINRLLDISILEKKEFDNFRLRLVEYWPEYMERNRKKYILNRIFELSEVKGFELDFYKHSQQLLKKLWEGIKYSKDDVIAGLIASIITLCQYKDKISINAICKFMNIRMSTVQAQVKRNIFERSRIPGFKTLVKSADILKKIVKRLGILSTAKIESEEIYVLEALEKRGIQPGNDQEGNTYEDEDLAKKPHFQEIALLSHKISEIELNPNKSELDSYSYQFIIRDTDTQKPICISLKIPIEKKRCKDFSDKDMTDYKINILDLNSKGPPAI
ncbi:MAG: hypothetical protein GF311_02090 [Candidatus Lokiarchaeota archaeon]|nr:hypothetical protein [Candidatus Lokiarchaeota archaeon]